MRGHLPQELADLVSLFRGEEVPNSIFAKRFDDSVQVFHKTYKVPKQQVGKTRVINDTLFNLGYVSLLGYNVLVRRLRFKLPDVFLRQLKETYLKESGFFIRKLE